jgi:hypothetical protein
MNLGVSKALPLAPGEFRFTTKAVTIELPQEGDGGKRRFKMVASSTIVDEGKDEIKMSALQDLRDAYQAGRNVFTDHEHKVDNVFGRTDTGVIKDSGERDPKTGFPIYDLHIAGVVNEPNPRMVQLADSIDGGYVTFGASIGARLVEAKRNKAGGHDIYHLDGKEVSLVGLPMNQRSWTYKSSLIDKASKAAAKVGDDFLGDDEDDEAETIEVGEAGAETFEVLVPVTLEATIKALDTEEGAALQRQGLKGEKASKCPECGDGASCDCTTCDCSSGYHSNKAATVADLIIKDDNPAEDVDTTVPGIEIEPSTDGQESESESAEADAAEPPETPEPASDASGDDEEAEPAAEKALTFETADVIELAMKARDLAQAVNDRDDEIETLKAENTRLTDEIEEAKKVIEKVLALPLTRKATGHVNEFSKRLPDFLAPEVKDYLTKSAGEGQ